MKPTDTKLEQGNDDVHVSCHFGEQGFSFSLLRKENKCGIRSTISHFNWSTLLFAKIYEVIYFSFFLFGLKFTY
jgi:hypothetical protein